MTTRPALQAVVVFLGVTGFIALLFQLSRSASLVGSHLHALVAAVFLLVPSWIARRAREDLGEYGFSLRPAWPSLLMAAWVSAIVFSLFLVGFVLFYQATCGGTSWGLENLAPGLCHRFVGWKGLAEPRAPMDFLDSAITQVVVVAVPEELFFRGYLLRRLEEAFPPRRRLLGGGIGIALATSALLFALGHVLVDGDFRRMAVFFPGLLFGWMRSATGSILAGSIVHAASNLYIEALHRTFFP
ncbi:MAG: CPBP family intramembrane metalloprotease [Deltaproteobacteria bacterium]|nr:CPBP family intramembrane metalloprotease [Deltaproteobacteria bacterium]